MAHKNNTSINLVLSITICIFLFVFTLLLGITNNSATASQYNSMVSPPIYYSPISQKVNEASFTSPQLLSIFREIITDTQTSTPTTTSTSTFTSTPTNTASPTSTSTPSATPSPTPSPTFTSSPSLTPSLTSTATKTPTLYPTQLIYFPYILKQPTYTPTLNPIPQKALFCDNLNQPLSIPDNDPSGVNNDILVSDERVLVNLKLYVDITHSWVGDLVIKLTNQNTGRSIIALDRPGTPPVGCGNNDVISIFADYAAQPADDQCASYPHAISGIYQPSEALSTFSGINASGSWRINVSDRYQNDIGKLNHWCLETQLAEIMPAPTPTPTPVNLPSSANVSGMTGQDQHLNLDCESRSAVDWAKHFGYNINEITFLNHLPRSDDPEKGFVGNPDGNVGNLPPNDYGVHAPPVGSLLRDYGLQTNPFHSLKWDDIRAEIASGNPVIVWVIGGASYSLVNGTPHYYTAASTGETTIVARWEHTVIVVGYTTTTVTVLNGSHFVTLSLDQFLDSWSVLDFMAVLARP